MPFGGWTLRAKPQKMASHVQQDVNRKPYAAPMNMGSSAIGIGSYYVGVRWQQPRAYRLESWRRQVMIRLYA